MGHSVHTASFALPFVYMISEEGAAIANTKEKEVAVESSPHSYSEGLVHSNSCIEVLLSSIWWGLREGIGLTGMVG